MIYISQFRENALIPVSALKMEETRASEILVPFHHNHKVPHPRKY